MKPKRPVIICLASSVWVVVVPELSGLQFWIAQMPVRATAVMNPNLSPGLLVMRCMASAIGTRCTSTDRGLALHKLPRQLGADHSMQVVQYEHFCCGFLQAYVCAT